MTKLDKLVNKLFEPGCGFTHREAVSLLSALGYDQKQGTGSRVRFEKPGRKPILYHAPHNGRKELPSYVIEQLRIEVEKEL